MVAGPVYPIFKSVLKRTSVLRQALPLSVGEFADANEFALVAARGERLLCSAFEALTSLGCTAEFVEGSLL